MKPAATSKSKPDKRNLRSEPETPSEENFSPKRRKLELSDQSQILYYKTEDETTQKKRQEDLQVHVSSTEYQTKNKTKVQKPESLSKLLSENFKLPQTMDSMKDQPETNKESIAVATRTKPPKDEEMVHETQRLSFPERRRAGNISYQKATEDDEEEESPANETRKLPKSSLKVLRNLDEVKEEDDATEEELREGLWRKNLQDEDEENSGLDFYHQ